jgi:cytochrome c
LRSNIIVLAGVVVAGGAAVAADGPKYGFGRPATPQEIATQNIDVRADGAGLPPGQGSVAEGAEVYGAACAACHGEHGEHPVAGAARLVGGRGTLATPGAVTTVGSYWPYATTLFDYIRRAMPFTAPQSLTPDQVYAVTAYVLRLNDIVPDGTVLDAASLPKVRMPNRDGFVPVYQAGR